MSQTAGDAAGAAGKLNFEFRAFRCKLRCGTPTPDWHRQFKDGGPRLSAADSRAEPKSSLLDDTKGCWPRF